MTADRRLTYRPEIDGLRALSVLAIMLFHAGFERVAGGYLGVDILFVISGYLVTGLILSGENRGGFSLATFYMRRIRRLMPALIVTMLACLPLACMWMLPEELADFGQSLVATAGMANNLLLWRVDQGYWTPSNEFRPLAHTWSLGVEEQFYLLLPPLMICALRKRGRNAVGRLLGGLAVGSFTWALWYATFDPNGSFLLLPSRIWQLALGGLAQLATRRYAQANFRGRSLMAGAGLAAAVVPLGLGSVGEAVPTWQALPAVVGAAVFLTFGQAGTGVGRVMAARPLVAIGLVSYSAYLFHQPLFAFVRLLSLREPGPWLLAGLIPLVLLLAGVNWLLVERPFRDAARVRSSVVLSVCAIGLAACAAAGLWLHFSHGLQDRWRAAGGYSAEIDRPLNIAYVDAPYRFQGVLPDAARRDRNVLFIGQSFARDAVNMALETGAVEPSGIRYTFAVACDEGLARSVLAGAARFDTAIIAAAFAPSNLPCWTNLASRLEKAGTSHVVLLGYKQLGWSIAAAMRLPPDDRRQARLAPDPVIRAIDRRTADILRPSGRFISILQLIEDNRGLVPVLTPDGRLLSIDSRHLTPAGARWLGELVFAQPALRHLSRSDPQPGNRPPDR